MSGLTLDPAPVFVPYEPGVSSCRRGCCWSPYQGVCPRDWSCKCHHEGAIT